MIGAHVLISPPKYNGVDWTTYTPTFNGFGTATSVGVFYRRVGDSIDIKGNFVAGTIPSTSTSFTMPSGLTINTTVLAKGNTTANPGPMVGFYAQGANAGSFGAIVTATGTSTSLLYFAGVAGGSATLTPGAGAQFTSNQMVSFLIQGLPITGYTSYGA